MKKFLLFYLLFFTCVFSKYFLSFGYCVQADSYYHYLLGGIAEMKGDLPKAIEEYKESILYDTESVYLKKQLANLYILIGDTDAASQVLSEISKIVPNDKSTTELLSKISAYNKKPEDAISAYKKIPSAQSILFSDSKQSIYNLGILYSNSGEYEKAISCFEKFLQIDPDAADVYVNIGVLYYKLNRTQEAELYLKKAAESDLNSISSLLTLADIYEEKKDYDKAIELYNKLVKILPDETKLLIKIAEIYIAKKDYLSAKKYLVQAQKLFQKDYWINFYLGLLSTMEKDYKTAMEYFDESISINKKLPEPYMQKGYIFTIQKDIKKAIKYFEKSISLGIKTPDAYFFLAVDYEVLDKYKKSEHLLKKAIEIEPRNIHYRFELGVVYDKLNKQELAEKEFFKIIEIDSNSAVAYNYLGYIWADKNIKLNEAEEFIKKALEIEPENPAYIDSLGWVFYRQKKYVDALILLKKTSEKIDDPIVFDHLGDCHFALGDNEAAVDNWETSFFVEKNKVVKKKIKKHSKNLIWSQDMIKLRALKSFNGIQDISGFVSANTACENKGYGVNGPFFFKKPKQLRLEILGPFAISQGLILMRQETIVYSTPDKKQYNLTDNLFWVKDIFSIFDAECFGGLNFITAEKDFYVFKNDFLEMKVDKKEHTISEIKLSDGSIITLCEYDLLGKRKFPHKLDFASSNKDMKTIKATLILKKLNFNKNIKIDLFNEPK
ncbi:MAG: tetratricopeptide repeat protein [Elusimicrobiota bacterium]